MLPPRRTTSLYAVCASALLLCIAGVGAQFPGSQEKELLPQVCGRLLSTDRIFNGAIAPMGTYGWMVSLAYLDPRTNKTKFQCAATLISSRYALTAGQCVDRFRPNELHLGDWDFGEERDCQRRSFGNECPPPPVVVGVEEIIIHPDFNKRASASDDIALIRFNTTVDFDRESVIEPICLPPSDFQILDVKERIATSTGWEIYSSGRALNTFLLVLDIPLASDKICRSIYKERFVEKQLCAGGTDVGLCLISGSPLFIPKNGEGPMILIGFVSYGISPCGADGKPDVYTSVSDYRSWILSNLRP